MSSLVSVIGTIVNPIQRTDEGLCRFSVENEDGRFYIQVPWVPQLKSLCQSEQVHIVGELHSFHFKRCRSNHVYIEPLAIIQGSESIFAKKRETWQVQPNSRQGQSQSIQ